MNDNLYTEEQNKVIKDVQSKMYTDVKSNLELSFKLHQLNQEQRRETVFKLLYNKASKLNLSQNIFKKAIEGYYFFLIHA